MTVVPPPVEPPPELPPPEGFCSSGFLSPLSCPLPGSTLTRSLFTPGSEYQVSTALSVRWQSAAVWARVALSLGAKFTPSPLSRPSAHSLLTASCAHEDTSSRSAGFVVTVVSAFGIASKVSK